MISKQKLKKFLKTEAEYSNQLFNLMINEILSILYLLTIGYNGDYQGKSTLYLQRTCFIQSWSKFATIY